MTKKPSEYFQAKDYWSPINAQNKMQMLYFSSNKCS